MGYTGLGASEHSRGERVRRYGITKPEMRTCDGLSSKPLGPIDIARGEGICSSNVSKD